MGGSTLGRGYGDHLEQSRSMHIHRDLGPDKGGPFGPYKQVTLRVLETINRSLNRVLVRENGPVP